MRCKISYFQKCKIKRFLTSLSIFGNCLSYLEKKVYESPFIELVIPAVTVAGKLTFTINYLEETTDTPMMERIKNKALEYLGLVK